MGAALVGTAHFSDPDRREPVIYEWLTIGALALLMGASLFMLLNYDWRRSIVALAVQYLAAFWLINLLWPLGLATVKLVVGWMVCAVLGASIPAETKPPAHLMHLSNRIFRFLAASMVWILAFSIAPALAEWLPTGMTILWGGLMLIGIGMLQMGMTTRPSALILGLLTVLSGFEVLYSVVETSVLVTGLLAIVNLGLALVGSYLLSAVTTEENL